VSAPPRVWVSAGPAAGAAAIHSAASGGGSGPTSSSTVASTPLDDVPWVGRGAYEPRASPLQLRTAPPTACLNRAKGLVGVRAVALAEGESDAVAVVEWGVGAGGAEGTAKPGGRDAASDAAGPASGTGTGQACVIGMVALTAVMGTAAAVGTTPTGAATGILAAPRGVSMGLNTADTAIAVVATADSKREAPGAVARAASGASGVGAMMRLRTNALTTSRHRGDNSACALATPGCEWVVSRGGG